ncbi:unnamed protein product [Ostreobium quekettii]|uniref:phosphoserine transaminase n=1 Tax=Ostreobium quekettii TaxID=121088 RepID=A0A8S1J5R6_9CHLO|nr:unnamed protein product [Ostreobium quekettii]
METVAPPGWAPGLAVGEDGCARGGSGRAHNFSAGPAMLDTEVMTYIQKNLLNYQGCGMGIHEMSHRDVNGPVAAMMERTSGNVRRLLGVPDNYRVLFFQGGAHGQFAAVPLNLFGKSGKGDYVIGGNWSTKAMNEASKYGEVRAVADTTTNGHTYYAPVDEWDLSDDSAYVHVCTNETVQGLAMHEDPDVGPNRVLVSDMTSSLFSRPVDIKKYGVIYASGGKNLGPAGCCLVIVRDDLLEQSLPQVRRRCLKPSLPFSSHC